MARTASRCCWNGWLPAGARHDGAVEVPGLTAELKEAHEGRVVQVLPLPAADTTAALAGMVSYHATVAFQRSTSGPPCRIC